MNRTYSNLETSGSSMSRERNRDRMDYMMFFCALMLVNSSKATLEQSLQLVPLAGRAKSLAKELVEAVPSSHPRSCFAS